MSDGSIQHLLDALPSGAVLLDASARVLQMSERFRRIVGAHDESIMGHDFFERFEQLQGVASAREVFREGVRGGSLHDSFLASYPSVRGDAPRSFKVHMHSLLGLGDAFALLSFVPIEDEPELRRTVQSLEFRLASIGPLKHELSNKLMGVIGCADLLLERGTLSATQRAKVETILEQCRLIESQLIELSRLQRRVDAD